MVATADGWSKSARNRYGSVDGWRSTMFRSGSEGVATNWPVNVGGWNQIPGSTPVAGLHTWLGMHHP
jgi:hypothetical protein